MAQKEVHTFPLVSHYNEGTSPCISVNNGLTPITRDSVIELFLSFRELFLHSTWMSIKTVHGNYSHTAGVVDLRGKRIGGTKLL